MSEALHDSTTALLEAVAETYGLGRVYGHRFLSDGLMNRNWRVETETGVFAVKEITDVPLEKVRRNLAVLPGLQEDGVPVPVPLAGPGGSAVAEVAGHDFCVMPWVEGAHVQGVDLTEGEVRTLGTLLGRVHGALRHHTPAPVPDQPPRTSVTDPLAAREAADKLRALLPSPATNSLEASSAEALAHRRQMLHRYADLRPTTDRPTGPYGWTHGDFQYRNLLRRGGEVVAVLDWDRLGIRPYAEEVVRTAQVQFGVGGRFDLERVAAFVNGYRSVIPLSAAALADGLDRLWWKRMTDFWQLEFYLDRHDSTFGDMFLADEALLVWWTEHLSETREAFTAG